MKAPVRWTAGPLPQNLLTLLHPLTSVLKLPPALAYRASISEQPLFSSFWATFKSALLALLRRLLLRWQGGGVHAAEGATRAMRLPKTALLVVLTAAWGLGALAQVPSIASEAQSAAQNAAAAAQQAQQSAQQAEQQAQQAAEAVQIPHVTSDAAGGATRDPYGHKNNAQDGAWVRTTLLVLCLCRAWRTETMPIARPRAPCSGRPPPPASSAATAATSHRPALGHHRRAQWDHHVPQQHGARARAAAAHQTAASPARQRSGANVTPAAQPPIPSASLVALRAQPVAWLITSLRGESEYTIVAQSSNLLKLQSGRHGGMFMVTASVIGCLTAQCTAQQASLACADVASGQRLAHGACNAGFATATWGVVTIWECVLVAIAGLALLLSCLVCINGTAIVPGIWTQSKEPWAMLWSHTNPMLRRKPPPEVVGDEYDRKLPAVKPRMFRSAAQQQREGDLTHL